MKRRVVFGTLGVGGLAVVGWPAWKHWPDQGIWNPCLASPLPPRLAKHELMQAAWENLDAAQLWDSHVHLVGVGDSERSIYVNPANYSLLQPFP